MKRHFFLIFVLLSIVSLSYGQLKLPQLFTDHMMLQRDIEIPVWGKATAGTVVKVELNGNITSTTADENGDWNLFLPKMRAGGPYMLKVYHGNQSAPDIKIEDILLGDIWLASGQSNMEWQVQQSMNAKEEIINANYPEIRLFRATHDFSLQPLADLKGGFWQICDSNSIKETSAVAYYFARELYNDLNVPIGIIQSTWGGTPVEAWTSREKFLSTETAKASVYKKDSITRKHFQQDSLDVERFWDIVYNPKNGTDHNIPAPDFDDSNWENIIMPSTIKDWDWQFYEGMMWVRKQISIPDKMLGKDLEINLGHPELNYSLYFNGTEICKTIWNAEPHHIYSIPSNLVKSANTIVVRIAVLWGGGGFNPPAENMYITDGTNKISIAGEWKYKIGLEPDIPFIKNYHQYPSMLFNAMINPIIPYGIKGFIWYQGENNVPDAFNYRELFPLMINDWRVRWKQGYLPFFYVQLANYMKSYDEPTESDWALLRESQTETLNEPVTGMACIIDKGEAESIHPLNKQEVGKRLALLAEKQVYGYNLQAVGPIFKDFKIIDNRIRITFDEIGEGLATRGNDTLKGFAIAGKDKKFYWANARIEGNTVIVSSKKVKEPVAVRYAWADNPVCNLINREGLPAVPFRTDSWETIENNK